jgi:uncharacterized protein involved in type VI secretion and phage assembly
MPKFFGKYRGKVVDNQDPQKLGRVQVSVPAVFGESSGSWAMPCTPYAGPGVGLYLIPPVDANVWVEFEAGDPNFPIWVGCFWSTGEVPQAATEPKMRVLKCDNLTLSIEDENIDVSVTVTSDGVVVETNDGKFALNTTEFKVNDDGLIVE